MTFDGDYTPEGLALQGAYAFNKEHTLKWNTAVFILDEINQGPFASDDPYLLGAQLRYDAKWTRDLSSTLGVAWYHIVHDNTLVNGAVPNVNVGNTRYAAATGNHVPGELVHSYHPVVIDAAVTYTFEQFPAYRGPFPVRLGGEIMHNSGAPDDNLGWWGGIFFGRASKKHTWELSYRYKYLERDAWYEELVDSDFGAYYQALAAASAGQGSGYRAGTGIQGHIVRANYALSDGFTIGLTYFLTELIDTPSVFVAGERFKESGTHRVQLDAVWKF